MIGISDAINLLGPVPVATSKMCTTCINCVGHNVIMSYISDYMVRVPLRLANKSHGPLPCPRHGGPCGMCNDTYLYNRHRWLTISQRCTHSTSTHRAFFPCIAQRQRALSALVVVMWSLMLLHSLIFLPNTSQTLQSVLPWLDMPVR